MDGGMRKRTIRLSEELVGQIREQSKKRGFATASAFMRAAIEKELASPGATFDATEERLAATIDRLAGELRRLRTGQQGLFAFLDALTKTVLTCLPEPSGENYAQAVARAKARYERFLKSVGMGVAGDTQAALDELTGRIQ
jgi:Arc/MetJ-type ribon-helix-helix transcriptional regulator